MIYGYDYFLKFEFYSPSSLLFFIIIFSKEIIIYI